MIKSNFFILFFLVPSIIQAQSLKDSWVSEMQLVRLSTKAAIKKARLQKLTNQEIKALSQFSKQLAVVIMVPLAGGCFTWFYLRNRGSQNNLKNSNSQNQSQQHNLDASQDNSIKKQNDPIGNQAEKRIDVAVDKINDPIENQDDTTTQFQNDNSEIKQYDLTSDENSDADKEDFIQAPFNTISQDKIEENTVPAQGGNELPEEISSFAEQLQRVKLKKVEQKEKKPTLNDEIKKSKTLKPVQVPDQKNKSQEQKNNKSNGLREAFVKNIQNSGLETEAIINSGEDIENDPEWGEGKETASEVKDDVQIPQKKAFQPPLVSQMSYSPPGIVRLDSDAKKKLAKRRISNRPKSAVRLNRENESDSEDSEEE